MGKLFDLEAEGYFYTRLQNPTNDAVAAKITALEGGVAGMLTSSGQAANYYALFNICEAGDHIVCSNSVYGGTYNLFGTTMKKQGVECTFVDPDAPYEELCQAIRPNTKAVFAETIANPSIVVLDIEKFARLAHEHGVPLIVDNTFATPINCRPFEWGADIVTHSTTKYMDGHAMAVGGAIIDSGNFDWLAHADKFPGLTTPDESYHGITYAKKFGKAAYIMKATAQLMRDLGSIPSPMNAFLLNVGLETLHLRVARHCENAQKVAEFLAGHEKVAWVNYAGAAGQPLSCAGREIYAKRHLWGDGIWHPRGQSAGDPFYGCAETGVDRHPCGGCENLHFTSGEPYTPADDGGAVTRGGDFAGFDASVCRDRECGGHHWGSGSGVVCHIM